MPPRPEGSFPSVRSALSNIDVTSCGELCGTAKESSAASRLSAGSLFAFEKRNCKPYSIGRGKAIDSMVARWASLHRN